MSWDRVLTVNDYYDGPRLGVAEVNGQAHIYEAEFDHSTEEYGDTYFVSPIDTRLLSLVLENWEIWLRWEDAHRRGDAAQETHPALPEDRERHEFLKHAIGDLLHVDQATARLLRAEFRWRQPRLTEVQWSETNA